MRKIWCAENILLGAALFLFMLPCAGIFGSEFRTALDAGVTNDTVLSLIFIPLVLAAFVLIIPDMLYRHVEFDAETLVICGAYRRRSLALASVSRLERTFERWGRSAGWRWYAYVPKEEPDGWLEQVRLPLPSSPDSAGVQELIAAMRNANSKLRLDIQENRWG